MADPRFFMAVCPFKPGQVEKIYGTERSVPVEGEPLTGDVAPLQTVGAGPDTVVGAGSKIDNLIQIGHKVQLGRGCVLVAQSGVAGSPKLEDFVMVGAQGGIAVHLTIGQGAQVAGQSGVLRDVPAGTTVFGASANQIKDFSASLQYASNRSRQERRANE